MRYCVKKASGQFSQEVKNQLLNGYQRSRWCLLHRTISERTTDMPNQSNEVEVQVKRHQWFDPAVKNEPGIVRLLCEQLKDHVQSRGPHEVVFVWIHESGDFEDFCERELKQFRELASTCFYIVSKSERCGKVTVRLPLPDGNQL